MSSDGGLVWSSRRLISTSVFQQTNTRDVVDAMDPDKTYLASIVPRKQSADECLTRTTYRIQIIEYQEPKRCLPAAECQPQLICSADTQVRTDAITRVSAWHRFGKAARASSDFCRSRIMAATAFSADAFCRCLLELEHVLPGLARFAPRPMKPGSTHAALLLPAALRIPHLLA